MQAQWVHRLLRDEVGHLMAYYSGSANDMTAVRNALVSACVDEGWAWNSSTEVLSLGTLFLRLQVVSGFLRLRGRTAPTSGDMNHDVQMGPFTGYSEAPLPVLAWPLSYELFIFEHEVYCIINYSVDCYQWCAWGKSTVQGLPGTGLWVGATAAGAVSGYVYGGSIAVTGGSGSGNWFSPALFWANYYTLGGAVHSDLDGQGWWMGQSEAADPVGISHAAPLIGLLPNAWNSEAVLLPIRAYKIRPSQKVSLVADLEFSRSPTAHREAETAKAHRG